MFAICYGTRFSNCLNTYFSAGHIVEGFGQTIPIGLAAKQTMHDDDRRFLSTICSRLVRRKRHFDGFQFGAQRPATFRSRSALLKQARPG
jgi:hypothetical protein